MTNWTRQEFNEWWASRFPARIDQLWWAVTEGLGAPHQALHAQIFDNELEARVWWATTPDMCLWRWCNDGGVWSLTE